VQSGSFEIGGVMLTEKNVSRTAAFKNLLHFKGEFSLGKARIRWKPNLYCIGFDRKVCTRAVAWTGALS